MNRNQKELQALIFEEIEHCETSLFPYVCGWRKTPEGRELLANYLEDIILHTGCTIQAALDRLEKTYNPNITED